MGTIYPAQHRNAVTPRTELTWQAVVAAVIYGWEADFGSIVGGETVTIQVAYGVPTLITMLAGDNSDIGVRDRINATFPGLASVQNGRIVLTDLAQVAVTSISQADFLLIGLPELGVDTAAPASNQIRPQFDPNPGSDWFSVDYIDLPDNANKLGVWVYLAGNDEDSRWGAEWGIVWSNGVDGEPPYTGAAFGAYTEVINPASVFPSMADEFSSQAEGYLQLYHTVGASNGVGFRRIYEVDVPIGATRARVFVRGVASNGATPYTPANPPPRRPPVFGAALIGGAR
jgi:hypothetical protein